jgi:hypothetical protein
MHSLTPSGHDLTMSSDARNSLPDGLARAGRQAVAEIAERDRRESLILLHSIVRAAWPTRRAQNQ